MQVAAREDVWNGRGGSSCDLWRSVLYLRGGGRLDEQCRQGVLKDGFPV